MHLNDSSIRWNRGVIQFSMLCNYSGFSSKVALLIPEIAHQWAFQISFCFEILVKAIQILILSHARWMSGLLIQFPVVDCLVNFVSMMQDLASYYSSLSTTSQGNGLACISEKSCHVMSLSHPPGCSTTFVKVVPGSFPGMVLLLSPSASLPLFWPKPLPCNASSSASCCSLSVLTWSSIVCSTSRSSDRIPKQLMRLFRWKRWVCLSVGIQVRSAIDGL